MVFGANAEQIGLVLGGLFLFGLLYNAFVAALEARGYDEGYTAILVVFGTLVTLAGVACIDLDAALLALAAFAASGTPMVLGSWWRYASRRRSAMHDIKNDQA